MSVGAHNGVMRQLFLCIVFFSSALTVNAMEQEDHRPQPDWFGSTAETIDKSTFFLKQYEEVLSLIQAFMDLPYIISLDTTDEATIRASSSMAAAATIAKVLQLLIVPPTPIPLLTAKTLIWDAPKLGCYLLSICYDTIRFMDAPRVACVNKIHAHRLKGLKINQLMQLSIEVVLRLIVLLSTANATHRAEQAVTACAASLADIVCIWRRLSRYITYFMYTEMIEFKITIDRKIVPEFDINPDGDDLDALTTYADALLNKNLEIDTGIDILAKNLTEEIITPNPIVTNQLETLPVN